jgi:hypothetical protein
MHAGMLVDGDGPGVRVADVGSPAMEAKLIWATLITGSLGAVLAGIGFLIRAIIHNTTVTQVNTATLGKVDKTLANLTTTVTQHTVDIAILQDRSRRR